MTAIYCVKCRSITNTKQEKERLLQMDGIDCPVYVLPAIQKRVCLLIVSGRFMKRLPRNKRRPRLKKIERSAKKEAFKIGWKFLGNPEAEECVKICLAKIRKQNK